MKIKEKRIKTMKTRIISGAVFVAVIVAVMCFMNTVALPIFLAFVCGLAVFELNRAAGTKKEIAAVSVLVAAYIPFEIKYNLLSKVSVFAALAIYVIAMLIMMVKWHDKVKFEQVAIAIFCSLAVPESLGCWIRLGGWQDLSSSFYTQAYGYYLVIFAMCCAWLSDTFAYFTGVFFGKHKMTPVVSPKKTWEGAIGGVLLTAALNVGVYFLFDAKFFAIDFPLWNWWAVIPISIVLSIVSIFGDLSASVIKRGYGIKDYGKIMPGHGGIMDRFDSALFVFPTLYSIVWVI